MNLKHVKASLRAALPALKSALKAYAASLVFQAIVIAIVTIDDGDAWVRDRDVGNYAFDEVTYVVLSSFVGISYGDLYPIGIASRAMMCLLSMGGCVFQLFLLGLVIQAAIEAAEAEGLIGGSRNISSPGTPPFEKFMQLLPLYLFLVLTLPILSLLVFAFEDFKDETAEGGPAHVCAWIDKPGVVGHCYEWTSETPLSPPTNDECNTMCQLGNSIYLVWMTFHGTTYGEVLPVTFTGRVICTLAGTMRYFMLILWAAAAAFPTAGIMGNAALFDTAARSISHVSNAGFEDASSFGDESLGSSLARSTFGDSTVNDL